ncbi:hypothetical protein BB559_006254 [Furculomyces boomerangus]|uniref:SLM1/RGC1-like BAR-like domain-containing protein n=1 Tax=Furculomyces boomerangus TaxID=61424 RepID=A0A2T9Y414_9FUNG|nr:hypothetical protein BB559_006254 [Furculomyces boomerangus]
MNAKKEDSKKKRQIAIKKSDIKVDVGNKSTKFFVTGTTSGTGRPDDLTFQRLTAYTELITEYIEYFRRFSAATMDLSLVYARIADVLTVPMNKGDMFIPLEENGLQSMMVQSKSFQQYLVEEYMKLSKNIKEDILADLSSLLEQLQAKIENYKINIGFISGQLVECDSLIQKKMTEIKKAYKELMMKTSTKDIKLDPYFMVIDIERHRHKRDGIAMQLKTEDAKQQHELGIFEEKLVEKLCNSLKRFYKYQCEVFENSKNECMEKIEKISLIKSSDEFLHFSNKFKKVLDHTNTEELNGKTENPKFPEVYFKKNSVEEMTFELKVIEKGFLVVTERQMFFKKVSHRAYLMLTSSGYLHVYLTKNKFYSSNDTKSMLEVQMTSRKNMKSTETVRRTDKSSLFSNENSGTTLSPFLPSMDFSVHNLDFNASISKESDQNSYFGSHSGLDIEKYWKSLVEPDISFFLPKSKVSLSTNLTIKSSNSRLVFCGSPEILKYWNFRMTNLSLSPSKHLSKNYSGSLLRKNYPVSTK